MYYFHADHRECAWGHDLLIMGLGSSSFCGENCKKVCLLVAHCFCQQTITGLGNVLCFLIEACISDYSPATFFICHQLHQHESLFHVRAQAFDLDSCDYDTLKWLANLLFGMVLKILAITRAVLLKKNPGLLFKTQVGWIPTWVIQIGC